MGRAFRSVAAYLTFSVVLALSVQSARAESPVLGVALIAPQSAPALEARWAPLLAALSQATGTPVKAHFFPDYAGAVWSMRDDQSQIGWFGNKSAIEAVDFAEGEVFARKVDVDGEGGYYSYLIARQDAALRSVEDVKANAARLTLAMGNPTSTSGAVVPGHYLFSRLHMDPREAFKRVVTGTHEENWRAVGEGRADVATLASMVHNRLCQDQPAACDRLTIIWASPLIPNDPLVWRKTLPDELKARIRAFFATYGRPGPGKSKAKLEREVLVLRGIDTLAFVPSDNGQLQPIRDIQNARSHQPDPTDGTPTFAARLLPATAPVAEDHGGGTPR